MSNKRRPNYVEPEVETTVEEEVAEPRRPRGPRRFKAVVNCNRLRIRSEASTESDILDVVANGTELVVFRTSDQEWLRVELANGGTGFVKSEFVDFAE